MIIEFYYKENGDCPVIEFIDSLDEKFQSNIIQTIDLLKDYGPAIDRKHSKFLINGLFELRIKQEANNARILYFFTIGNKAILTNGFVKKTKKTPISEINLAIKYRRDYLRRVIR